MNPHEKWCLDYITKADRVVTASEINKKSYWSVSVISKALNYLVTSGLIVIVRRTRFGHEYATQEVAARFIADSHPLSQVWPTKPKIPVGRLRYIRGIIHDEAA